MLYFTATLMIICLTALTYLLKYLLPNGRPPLPPGPSAISLIYEAFQASSRDKEHPFSRWAHKYGDIVHLSIVNRHIILINSAQMAIDMQESKSPMYSDRDQSNMMKLVGWTDALAFANPGVSFKQQRGYLHRLFGTPAALSKQHGIIESECHRFLRYLLSSPDLADCIKHFVGSIVLKMTYGYTTREQDDPLVYNADKTIRELSLAIGLDESPWIVNILPILAKLPDWFPGAGFKKLAKIWSDNLEEVTNTPMQFVKEQITAGTAVPSFISTILADGNISLKDEKAIKFAAMSIYVAGSDTTISIIRGFFLLMALNPNVFRKAREEIDSVVGAQRLPSVLDKPALPYINALIRELFRWVPAVPNGLPHKTTRDDVHGGYFIPKGAIILSNIQLMMSDTRLYKDPKRFMPERFLGDNPERDPRDMVFGFGRRRCPGRLLAEDDIFAACAMIIATFDIQKKIKNGIVIEPVYRLAPGLVSHPEPYEIEVKPRSDQAVALIQATAHA